MKESLFSLKLDQLLVIITALISTCNSVMGLPCPINFQLTSLLYIGKIHSLDKTHRPMEIWRRVVIFLLIYH